jgi:hypothetical protein
MRDKETQRQEFTDNLLQLIQMQRHLFEVLRWEYETKATDQLLDTVAKWSNKFNKNKEGENDAPF